MEDKICVRCSRSMLEVYSSYDIEENNYDFTAEKFCLSCQEQYENKMAEVLNNLLTVNVEGDPMQNLATALLALAFIEVHRKQL